MMITSDQQLRTTLIWARKFKKRAQSLLQEDTHPLLFKACVDAMLSTVEDLEREAEEYLNTFED